MEHTFMLQPGLWEGKGTITFSMAEDAFPFTMSWNVIKDDGKIGLSQVVEIEGFEERMENLFSVNLRGEDRFDVSLKNHLVGQIEGTGLIDPKVIAWEFRGSLEFEGFELYELQEDGSYKMKAEFTSGDGLHTFVSGSISKRVTTN